ncbi:MAG: multidrug transporter [Paenibacillaceae bacterium]|nr:multidrug transporter [Paenibacillaceae bacterium]
MKQVTLGKEAPATGSSKLLKVGIALFAVYLFWGGTYLGMKVAIETMPPFLMAGIRFLIAGAVLYVVARMKDRTKPSLTEWRNAGIVGAMLLLGGNGIVAWAEQKVPSSIASLLVAAVPLWMIVFNWMGSRKKPNPGIILGVILGLVGIFLLVWQSGGGTDTHGFDFIGIAALIVASISWSAGSLFSRTAKLPSSPLLSTALQMIVGGLLLLMFSFVLGDWSKLDVAQISLRSYAALGYLIVFGSIFGYTAYIWLLKNADPALVSTYAFVNPVVAVSLGWFLAGEQLGGHSLAAAIVIVAAVAIITISGKKKKA